MIRTSKEVTNIKDLESGVVVETKDGAKYSGSILVGADGVHSRIRQEMWRLADAEIPGYISKREREGSYEASHSFRCRFRY